MISTPWASDVSYRFLKNSTNWASMFLIQVSYIKNGVYMLKAQRYLPPLEADSITKEIEATFRNVLFLWSTKPSQFDWRQCKQISGIRFGKRKKSQENELLSCVSVLLVSTKTLTQKKSLFWFSLFTSLQWNYQGFVSIMVQTFLKKKNCP